MKSALKWLLALGGVIVTLFLIQLVPYGRKHTNPPILSEINWNTPKTRYLFYQACKNCHTNETVWPWYSRYAPASWLIQSDVDEGRANFNVSEWTEARKVNKGKDAAKELRDGDMPPWYYRPAHPEARLSKEDKAYLIDGLEKTFSGQTEEKK
jgi:hypothetical protein